MEFSTLPGPFGSYQLLERLGHGSFGILYMAEQTAPGRQVAIEIPSLSGHRVSFPGTRTCPTCDTVLCLGPTATDRASLP